MPSFSGVKTDAGIEVVIDVYTSANLFIPRAYHPRDELVSYDETIGVRKSASRNAAVADPNVSTYGGVKTADFADDWYYRIHMIPAQVILGSVTSDREVPITAWNAFLEPRTITAFESVVSDGVTVSPPPGFETPYEMLPLEPVPFVLTASTAGPALIDATFDITVDGVSYSLPIKGTRSVAFYFRPNWSSPFEETFEANSWVFHAADGTEQSGSSSGAGQKRTVSFGLTLHGRNAQAFSNVLFSWQDRSFGVPHWPESSHTTAEIAAGDSMIFCDTTKRSFKVGGSVFLALDEGKWETRSIKAMTAGSIETTTPLGYAWPEGSRAMPMLPGFIGQEVAASWLTDGAVRASVMFELEPSETPSNLTEVVAPITYNGYELYLGRVNWRNAMPVTFTSSAPRLSRNTGKLRTIPIRGFSVVKRLHTWTVRNIDEAEAMRQFVARRRGVARRVYMPSGLSDFYLLRDSLVSESSIDVQENEFGGLIGTHPARCRAIIHFRDGTYLCRKILTSAELAEGGTRLVFDAPHGKDVRLDNVKRISFLALYRFSSNVFSIRWLTDKVGEASAEMTVVRETS